MNETFENGRMNIAVWRIHVHPEWRNDTKNYDADLAVLILDEEVTFNRFIQPICLIPYNSDLESAKELIVVGYGLNEDKNFEGIPKIFKAPIQDNAICFLKNYQFAQISSRRTLCAGYDNGTSPSRGDGGGGVFVKINNQFHFRGIISTILLAYGNANPDFFISTDLTRYNDWIDEIIASVHENTDRFLRKKR